MQGHHGYLHLTSILFTIYQQVVACSRASLSQGYFMGPKCEFELKWLPNFAETDGHFPRRFASHETPGRDYQKPHAFTMPESHIIGIFWQPL
jgi:hypothetical protein